MQHFINKRVLIFGASGHIGGEIALAFASHGAKIALHYHSSEERAARLAQKLIAYTGSVFAVAADVRRPAEIAEAVRRSAAFMGGIDIVVNCVGIFSWQDAGSMTSNELDELFDVNVKSAFYMASFALPHLKRSKAGRFISIADTYGLSPSGKFAAYGASKSALIALSKGLAKELAPKVLVNCVCPGVVESSSRPDKASRRALKASLTGRTIPVTDIADAVIFLAKSSSVTGQVVCVDGGKNV